MGSFNNRRRCLTQLKKLADGKGIAHPTTGDIFWEGKQLSLHDDVDDVVAAAATWMSERGKDASHGWLLSHPLKKLQLYQRHIITEGKPETLVSKGLVTALAGTAADPPVQKSHRHASAEQSALPRWRVRGKRPPEYVNMSPEKRSKSTRRPYSRQHSSRSTIDVCPDDSVSNPPVVRTTNMKSTAAGSPTLTSPGRHLSSPRSAISSPHAGSPGTAATTGAGSATTSFYSAGGQPRRCFLSRSLLWAPQGLQRVGHCLNGGTVLSANGNPLQVTDVVHYPEREEQLTWVCTATASLLVTRDHRVVVVHGDAGEHETLEAGSLRVGHSVVLSGNFVEVVVMTVSFQTRTMISRLTFYPDEPVECVPPWEVSILSHGFRQRQARRSQHTRPRDPQLMTFMAGISAGQLTASLPTMYED